jgi:cyanate lyase
VLSEITQEILAAKSAKGLTFTKLAEDLGCHPIWLAAVCYRQASASHDQATRLLNLLGLQPALAPELTSYPIKGGLGSVVPTDPLVYRFYEIVQVYGLPLKDIIQELFGDGIMSAIDFTMNVEKDEDPKGDRVRITMSGKFLPYKCW